MLPMFTLPPLAAAAILSPEILQMWIGPLLAPYALWMGLSFVIPICTQYLVIGNVIFLTRPDVQARLNLAVGPATADLGRGRRRDTRSFCRTVADSRPGGGKPRRCCPGKSAPCAGP